MQVVWHKRSVGFDPNDFMDIMSKNNKKIGIISMGDNPKGKTSPADRIGNVLIYFQRNSCDLIVMVCNDSNTEEMSYIENHTFVEIKKTKNLGRNNYQKSDTAASQAIFNWLEKEVAKQISLNGPAEKRREPLA